MGKISEWVKSHAWASTVIALVVGLIIGVAAGTETDTTDTDMDDSELEELAAENSELRDKVSELEATLAEVTEVEPEPAEDDEEEPEPREQVVFRESGSTSTETETFTVAGPFEVRWNVDLGEGLGPVLRLYGDDGRSAGSWDTDNEGLQGRARINQGGTFYFDVRIYGAAQWRLTVRELGS